MSVALFFLSEKIIEGKKERRGGEGKKRGKEERKREEESRNGKKIK